MKKFLSILVLSLAFFPLFTNAQNYDEMCREIEECGDCVANVEESSLGYCEEQYNCDPEDSSCREYVDSCISEVTSQGFNSCYSQYLPGFGGNGGSEGGNGGSSIVGGVLNGTQLSNMGTALTQGGTGLLRIAIQLMPYAIAFTIILLIFGLIKNWSKLKNSGLGDNYYAGSRVKRNNGFNIGQDEIDYKEHHYKKRHGLYND